MQIKWTGLKALSQQTALVFAGKMTGACLGFVMSLIVARWMGPEEFGLFSWRRPEPRSRPVLRHE